MLTFLNNIFLPALAAGILPILIHLFTRRRLVRVPWPSLRFIQEIQKKQMKRMKIRQILLLILRTLILLLVIGAFARPAIRGVFGGGVGAHENTAVALLIDRSYSMGQEAAGVDLFVRAKHLAGDIISLLKEGDELLVVPFDAGSAELTSKPTRFFAGAQESVDSLDIAHSTTDIWPAISRTLEVLEDNRLLHKEIYVLTDNRAKGWRRTGKLDMPEGTRIYAIPIEPDDDRNLACTELEFPRTLLQKNVPFELTAMVRNYSPSPVSNHVLDLYIDDQRISQGSIDLQSGSAGQVVLRGRVESGGFHYGRVELEGDALPADNRRFFSIRIPEKIDVLVVGSREGVFIEKALEPIDSDFFAVEKIDYPRLPGKQLSQYGAIILSDPPVLTSAMGNTLRGFVERGGGLIVLFGGSETPEESFVSIFGESENFDVMAALGSETGGGRFYLDNADFDHPVFVPYADEGLPNLDFRRIAAIEKAQRSILTFSNGLPAVAEGEIGEGKVLICAFSADMRYGSLATSGFFVPLMHRLTQYSARDITAFDPGYIVGDRVVRLLDDYPVSAGASRILSPMGSAMYVTPRFSGGKAVLTTDPLDEAGIYRVFADTVLIDLFAVNLDPSESDPSELNKNDVEKIAPIIWLDSDSKIEEEILSARFGRELHHGMLILAFILMFAELALGSNWRRNRDYSDSIGDHGAL